MVTTVKLHNGVLTTARPADEGRRPNPIGPAVAWLHARGGGSFYVVAFR